MFTGMYLFQINWEQIRLWFTQTGLLEQNKFTTWTSGLQEKQDKSSSIKDIGPRSRNDLDLKY